MSASVAVGSSLRQATHFICASVSISRLLYSAPCARLLVESEYCSRYRSPAATSARASRFPSSSPKSSSSDHRRGLSAAALRCRQYRGRVANENVEVARGYHERTKHSEERLRANPHQLDWDNQPVAFKLYRDLETIPLPRRLEPGTGSALRAIAALVGPETEPAEQVPGLQALAR